jgi:hypothetical protein
MRTFEDDVLILRRSPFVLAAACAAVCLGAALAIAGWSSVAGPGLGLAVAWIGAGSLLYAWARNPGRAERPARARADRRGLFLNDALVIEAARLRGGWVQPRAHELPSVRIRVRGRADLELAVRNLEEARALLRALEIDAMRAPVRFWTFARPLGEWHAWPALRWAVCVLAPCLLLGLVAGRDAPFALALATVALVALFAGVVVPTRVTVGADGVLVRWLGTERFVAWSSVVEIEPFDGGVLLALAGGRWLTLRTPPAHERYHPEREAMTERMLVAWRSHGRSEADDALARLLRREGGRTREWVRSMRGLLRGENGYRRAAMPPERLWRVLEDAGADSTVRLGAALALAPSLDDAGRDRLRAAAAACAQPRVRVALATAASSAGASVPDEDIAAALDAIDATLPVTSATDGTLDVNGTPG